ncbi:MAG: ribonuclease HI family protein [Patescibacteria group bacterium]
MEAHKKIIIYTDGGSRGNPGPAALGVVIKDEKGETLKSYGEALGIKTNNEAEYEAVVYGLKKAKQLFGSAKLKSIQIEMRMDSQLIQKQLSGEYKIENEKLFPAFIKINNFQVEHGVLKFTHVPREKNRDADRMVNQALDGEQHSLL